MGEEKKRQQMHTHTHTKDDDRNDNTIGLKGPQVPPPTPGLAIQLLLDPMRLEFPFSLR